MSRSYKHFPVCYSIRHKSGKKDASRTARRYYKQDIFPHKGNSFKKSFGSYNIKEFKTIASFEEYFTIVRRNSCYDNLSDKELYKYWIRFYKRK